MSHDVDDDLRRLFAQSADSIEGLPAGFGSEVLTAGARRRRNRRATIGAGAAALALVAVAAIWQGPSLVDRSTPPTNHDETPTHMTTDAWVASLPRGDNLRAAYADGQTLHVGDSEVAITGDQISPSSQIDLVGRVTDGWLARVANVAKKLKDSTDTVGVVAPDGAFTPLTHQPKPFILAVVSPDGTMFAGGSQVRSTTTGEVLQTIPDGLLAVMWVDSGLVLYEQDDAADSDSTWLWDPNDPEIPASKVVYPQYGGGVEPSSGSTTPHGLMALNHAGCTELYDIGLNLQEPDTRYCEGPTFALSDSGSVALLRPWTAYDIDSGDKSTLPVPTLTGEFEDFDPRAYSTFFWEDDNNVVFDLEVGGNAATVYVRCVISSQHCEQATDKLKDFRRPMALSPVD